MKWVRDWMPAPTRWLLLLPVVAFILSQDIRHALGPYFLGANSDPSYAYLLNSLNLLNGYPIGHIDHPGTTLHSLGAAVIIGKWKIECLFGSCGFLVDSVLSFPESYLAAINITAMLLVSLALFFLGFRIYKVSGHIFPALIGQVSLFSFHIVGLIFARATPEIILLIPGILLITILLPLAKESHAITQGKRSLLMPIAAGIIGGAGVATKITFIPILLLILMIRGVANKAISSLFVVISFVAFTFPIHDQYPVFFSWVTKLATHRGRYGSGGSGVFDPNAMIDSFIVFCRSEPALFVFMAVYLIVIVAFFKMSFTGVKNYRNILIFCLVAMFLQVVLVAKHPGIHYLLPAMVIACFANTILAMAMCDFGFTSKIPSLNRVSRFAVAVAFTTGLFVFHMGFVSGKNTEANAYEADTFSAEYEDGRCLRVFGYRSSSLAFALDFGNFWAKNIYQNILAKKYPSGYSFSKNSYQFDLFGKKLVADVFLSFVDKGGCVLLQSTTINTRTSADKWKANNPGYVLSNLMENSTESIYRIVPIHRE